MDDDFRDAKTKKNHKIDCYGKPKGIKHECDDEIKHVFSLQSQEKSDLRMER